MSTSMIPALPSFRSSFVPAPAQQRIRVRSASQVALADTQPEGRLAVQPTPRVRLASRWSTVTDADGGTRLVCRWITR